MSSCQAQGVVFHASPEAGAFGLDADRALWHASSTTAGLCHRPAGPAGAAT